MDKAMYQGARRPSAPDFLGVAGGSWGIAFGGGGRDILPRPG